MLPAVAAYLRSLPAGIASYPEAQAKAAVLRDWLARSRLAVRLAPGQVPDEVEALAREPPPASLWIPEVHLVALKEADFELTFAGAGEGAMAACEQWMLEVYRHLLSSPLYKILFLVVSPERALVGGERRWSAFHRGSELRVLESRTGHARLEVSSPPGLFSELGLRAHGCALQAAGEAAGGRDFAWTLKRVEPGRAHYELTWK